MRYFGDNPYDANEEFIMMLVDKIIPLILDWRLKGIETPKPPMHISVDYCCRKGLVCDKCMEQMPEALAGLSKTLVLALVPIYVDESLDDDLAATVAFIVCMQVHRAYRELDQNFLTRAARAPSLMMASLRDLTFSDPVDSEVRVHLAESFESNLDRFEGQIEHEFSE